MILLYVEPSIKKNPAIERIKEEPPIRTDITIAETIEQVKKILKKPAARIQLGIFAITSDATLEILHTMSELIWRIKLILLTHELDNYQAGIAYDLRPRLLGHIDMHADTLAAVVQKMIDTTSGKYLNVYRL